MNSSMTLDSELTDELANSDRALIEHGYEPVAVRGKAPVADDWQRGTVTVERLAAERAAHLDALSIGLRTGRVVGVDIDVLDKDHVARIEALAAHVLGVTPFVRVGAKGAMLVYRNETPIKKITIATSGKERVEILGTGQQFVAFGLHPDTGRSYEWRGAGLYDPLSAPLSEVPAVTPEQLRDFAQQAGALLTELGYGAARVTGDLGAVAEQAPPSLAKGEPVTVDELVSVLRYLDPGASRSEWIELVAAIRATPGIDVEALQDIACKWSSGEYWKNGAPANYAGDADVQQAFDTMPPGHGQNGGVTYGSLKTKARAAGWREDPRSAAEVFAPYIAKLQMEASNENAPAVASLPRPISYRDVLAREVPPVRELIPGLLEKGVPTFLSAPGGSHKSRLLQQWGLCLDAGAKIWDRVVEPAKFVCLSYEDHGDEIARRAQTITRRFSLPIDSNAELWDLAGCDLPIAVVKESGEVEWTKFSGTAATRSPAQHPRSTSSSALIAATTRSGSRGRRRSTRAASWLLSACSKACAMSATLPSSCCGIRRRPARSAATPPAGAWRGTMRRALGSASPPSRTPTTPSS